jgi:hypothetical protein
MAVTILASIQILSALLLGLLALLLVLDPDATLADLGIPWTSADPGTTPVLEAASLAAVVTLLAGLELLAAVALMRLQRLGWTLTMLLAGLLLASQIFTWWSTSSISPVSMLLNVVTVLYLNQRQVRAAFDLADGSSANLEEERG